jgi:toxin ParE1/3/4
LRVRWLTLALDDLDHALDFIDTANPAAAKRVAGKIWKAAQLLAKQPAMGRPGRVTGTREWVIQGTPYIMAYRVRDGALEVLRVLHTAMVWPDEFQT